MTKTTAPKSLNAWTTVIAFIIAALFTSQGIDVNIAPETLADAFLTKEGIGLITFLGMNLATPIIKTVQRIQRGQWNAKLLISRNLIAHLISAAAVLIGLWLNEDTAGFVIALVTQGINFAWHTWGTKETPPQITGNFK